MEGKRLGGYRILKEIGSGGNATVHLAEVERPAAGLPAGEQVALKILHPHLIATPGVFKRFLREVQAGQSVDHPNLVRTHELDARELDGKLVHYLVLEYVQGQTLRELLLELGWCPENLCRHVGREVTRALAAIHAAGIVHRDLKPENVLITREEVVKLMDLGVAHVRDESERVSRTGQFVGTVLYAAPEQFRHGGTGLDGRADLYSLGLTLYELATGRHPFGRGDIHTIIQRQLRVRPDPPSRRNPQISPYFEELLLHLLHKDREERFPSAAALLEALEEGEASRWWRRRSSEIRAATRRPLRRIRIPRDSAVYGRDGEIRALREVWETARSGRGRTVLIEGEAGIGKSRLVDEFAATLEREDEDFRFLFGAYPAGGAATAARAFTIAFREHLGAEGLEAALASHLPETPSLVPAFAALLRGEPPPAEAERLSRDSIETLFVRLTRSLAREAPVVVCIDDLHHAPDEGRGLFAALTYALAEGRVLLIGTTRPGTLEDWGATVERLPHVSRLKLPRLGPRDLQLLLKDVLRSDSLAEELGANIAIKSDGNPYFLFEILRSLRETKVIACGVDGAWKRASDVYEISIPDAVKDLVQARISGLGEEDRDLLDMAACCGFEFDPLLVSEALGRGRIPTLKRLTHIQRAHRLVHAAGRQFVFDHHQVRESLYESLSELLREEYHLAVADARERLEGVAGADPEEVDGAVATDLCEHLFAAGRGDRALRWLEGALEHLEGRYRNADALRMVDAALSAPGLVGGVRAARLFVRKARYLQLLGRMDEERGAWEEAARIAEEEGDPELRVRVGHRLAYCYHRASRQLRARDVARRTLELARRTADRAGESATLGAMGVIYERRGRLHAARRRYERAVEIAREAGDRRAEAMAVGNLARLLVQFGRYEEARSAHPRALELFRELGDRLAESKAETNLAAWYYEFGRYGEAREHYERQLEISREIGYRRGEAMATGNIGVVHERRGRFRAAHDAFERERVLSRETGDRRGAAESRGHLALLYACLGAFGEARRLWERSLAVFREIGDRLWEALSILWIGTIDEEEGRFEEAERHFREALQRFRHMGVLVPAADALLFLGRLEIARGRMDEARRYLTEAHATGERLGVPAPTALAAAWLACLPDGDAEGAIRCVERWEDRLGHFSRAEARFALYRATGDPAHLAVAERLFHEMVEHAPPERRRTMRSRVGLFRRIRDAIAAG